MPLGVGACKKKIKAGKKVLVKEAKKKKKNGVRLSGNSLYGKLT